MPTTITHSTGTITPTVMDGYRATREPGTLIRRVIDRPSPAVSLRNFGLRTGEFTFVFASQDAAISAFDALSVKQVLTLGSTDLPTVNMQFVVAGGGLVIELDRVGRKVMTVTIPFQEVLP